METTTTISAIRTIAIYTLISHKLDGKSHEATIRIVAIKAALADKSRHRNDSSNALSSTRNNSTKYRTIQILYIYYIEHTLHCDYYLQQSKGNNMSTANKVNHLVSATSRFIAGRNAVQTVYWRTSSGPNPRMMKTNKFCEFDRKQQAPQSVRLQNFNRSYLSK